MPDPNLNVLWSRLILEACARAGVRDLVLCPGSRSGPLVIAASAMPGIRKRVLYDERSAAYFAVGLTMGGARPAAVLCTSGTAAANFLPAVVEASLAHRPLVVLTADRPPELRHSGAPQTIDQLHLYGRFVRAFEDLPLPAGTTPALRDLRSRVEAVCRRACGPRPGPVHLNIPLTDPLSPAPLDEDHVARLAREIEREHETGGREQVLARHDLLKEEPIETLRNELQRRSRGWIVAGPEAARAGETEPILRLARGLHWPLFADVASGLRVAAAADTACAHAELFLRARPLADESPEFVLRLGGLPTSKILNEAIARHRPPVVSIQPDGDRRDPDGVVASARVASPAEACARLARGIDSPAPGATAWRDRWLRADRAAAAALAEEILPLEAAALRSAIAAMPAGASIFLSSSMPIRWGEAYVPFDPGAPAVFANRGANGIDGVTSTAMGVAASSGRPLLLVTGDLAFLHDLNGLHAAREAEAPVEVLLLNNDGGGIFSYLPVSNYPEICEPLFATPHGRDLGPAGRIFSLEHERAAGVSDVAAAIRRLLQGGVSGIVEVRIDRQEGAAAHRAAIARVVAAVTEAVGA